jgi:hypothetical protein
MHAVLEELMKEVIWNLNNVVLYHQDTKVSPAGRVMRI